MFLHNRLWFCRIKFLIVHAVFQKKVNSTANHGRFELSLGRRASLLHRKYSSDAVPVVY